MPFMFHNKQQHRISLLDSTGKVLRNILIVVVSFLNNSNTFSVGNCLYYHSLLFAFLSPLATRSYRD